VSLRLFAAHFLTEDKGARLLPLQHGLEGARWRPVEAFHITLCFLDTVSEPVAEDLDAELARIRLSPFEITLSGAGWFGGTEPRAVWIGVKPDDRLETLARACERAARKVGLNPEKRRFTPHVTLAYLKPGTPLEPVASFCQRLGAFSDGPIRIDRFGLYSSWLGKGPSRYVQETEYPLA
jgi:RNA 2',3'-cyclic 3'-phosphodiesterase